MHQTAIIITYFTARKHRETKPFYQLGPLL